MMPCLFGILAACPPSLGFGPPRSRPLEYVAFYGIVLRLQLLGVWTAAALTRAGLFPLLEVTGDVARMRPSPSLKGLTRAFAGSGLPNLCRRNRNGVCVQQAASRMEKRKTPACVFVSRGDVVRP